jgi:GT2 family glycosyltransferase
MRIFHIIPWNTDKNLGKSYNESMSMVGSDDWICFIDGDAVHTSHFFGKRIEDVVTANPEYSMFTCVTNRVNCQYQIAPNVDVKNDSQEYHRKFGDDIWNNYQTQVDDITDKQNPLISGVLILIKKSAWLEVGGFKEDKMLTIDGDMHRRMEKHGKKIGLMLGIYVQHWYRGGDKKNITHLL